MITIFRIKLLVILMMFLALQPAEAQELEWAKQSGGSNWDRSYDIAVDGSGDSYVTGSFSGSATFGAGEANETTLNSSDGTDIFVAKYHSSGDLLWAKKAGGIHFDRGSSIAVDSSGDIYVTGTIRQQTTFGAGEANETTLYSNTHNIFVAKYHSSGDLLWVIQADGSSDDGSSGIVVDGSGDSYVTGHIAESVTFGAGEANETTLNSSGSYDIFIAKYHSSGNLLWAKKAGGSNWDVSHDIAVDGSGDSYVTGTFAESATFGAGEANETTLNIPGSYAIFVAKYHSSGDLLWVKQAGGSNYDSGRGIAVDVSGDSYVTGNFRGSLTFGVGEVNETTLNSSDGTDIFVAKYHSSGDLLWAIRAGGSSEDFGSGIAVDGSGDSYVTGSFSGSATFGAGEANETTLNSSGSYDIFIARFLLTPVFKVLEIKIDIKPGSFPNSINLKSRGKVPVAILTTDDFDAYDVDPVSCEFAGAYPLRWEMEDVDHDGDYDMLFHFMTRELDLTKTSSEATLVGETFYGDQITGTDSVNIVPKGNMHSKKAKKKKK